MTAEIPTKTPKSLRTRARIAQCAYDLFSTNGYARTGLRELGDAAGVAPSLIVRHFGSKADLFRCALINALQDHGLKSFSKEDFGAQVARHVSHEDHGGLTAMIILAMADPESRDIAREVCRQFVLDPFSRWLDLPDGRARALRALILMNGFVVQTRHMDSGDIPPDVLDWLARSIQDIVDGR